MKRYKIPVIILLLTIVVNIIHGLHVMKENKSNNIETATFGGGCFWCIEAIFAQIDGVYEVLSGYSGGKVTNPSYQQVCSGTTGHAEVVQVVFDNQVVSFNDLLRVFFSIHDPTTLNRQGNDTGSQYRSVIFYHNEKQKHEAEQYIAKLTLDKTFKNPIVTEVVAFNQFYKAEKYHQDYYKYNADKPYCSLVISPKIEKFQNEFKAILKIK
ncbi:MAG: peptide-methionine (S)-S-oxide reductase MsrA [Bacteroidales bacterium]|nr:peptide-methionine (S)-S-oxide reductase MsrA [Bacteroidales bacterium]